MTVPHKDSLEDRVRDLEIFAAEVRGGRKLLLWLCSAAGVALGLLAAFWERLFGGST